MTIHDKETIQDKEAEETKDHLVEYVSDEVRQWVENGWASLKPGRDAKKPIITATATHPTRRVGTRLPGSGVSEKHQDSANGRSGAIKQTQEYQALLRRLVGLGEDPEDRNSLAWLVDQIKIGIEGGPITKRVSCPECAHTFMAEMYKQANAMGGIKLVELLTGRAAEFKEVDVNVKALHAQLAETVPMSELQVHTIDPREKERRQQAVEVEAERLG